MLSANYRYQKETGSKRSLDERLPLYLKKDKINIMINITNK